MKSENSGLPVEVRMLDKKTFKRSKMVSVNYGLNILGKRDLVLKDKDWEIIRYITLEKCHGCFADWMRQIIVYLLS